jgi:hypothetical protein
LSPRVTVLLAVKDGLPWVRETVESVLAQSFEDFELLVVDDGSSDGTAAAIEAYGDPRIRILRNERNLGQVPSLNLGLEQAHGDLVARIDADDTMLPTRLERQVAALDAEPTVALVGTWMDIVDDRGGRWAELRGHVRDFTELVFAILVDRYPWGHPSIAFRRDVVRSLGGYDASLAPSEDKDLYRRLALARHDARSVDDPLVRYRRHGSQLSHEQREVQKRHDWAGQERFLAELAPGVPARPLRLLLAGDPAVWDDGPPAPSALDTLLAGARQRLDLTAEESRKLERLVGKHVARVACDGWRVGTAAQWKATPQLFAYGAARGGAARTPAYVAGLVLGPVLGPALRGAGRAARSEWLARVRTRAVRSGLLRRLYARLP